MESTTGLNAPNRSVTYGLLLVNLLVFIAMSVQGGSTEIEVLQRFGANDARRIWDGEYWRLITPIFLHIGMLHLLLNGFALLALGLEVERHLGGPLFLLLYLLSGLCGNIATLLFTHGLSAGASGAIFGLAGAILMLEVLHGQNPLHFMARREGYSILPVILINLILGFQIPQIDNNGHIGGLLGGMIFGYCLLAERLGRGAPERRAAVALAGVVLLAVSLGYGLFPILDSRWYSYRGITFLEHKDFGKARDLFIQATKAYPRSHLPYLLLGEAEEGLNRPVEALRAYTQAVSIKPDDPLSLDKLGQAHASAGRFAVAVPYLEKAIRLYDPPRRRYDRLGMAYEQMDRHDKALVAFKSAAAIRPHDDAVWLRLGVAYLSGPNRDHSSAKECFDRAVGLQPRNPLAVSMRAHCLLRLGRFEESLNDAAQVVKLHPKDGLGYMDAAAAYMALQQFEKAVECAVRAVKLSPANTRGHELLVKAFRAAGKQTDAQALDDRLRAAYEKTYEHDPSPNNANNLAWFYAERGIELSKAIEIAEKAVAAKPEAAYIDTLGWARLQAGDAEGAIRDLERAVSLDADEVLSYHLAVALAKEGKRAEALEALERGLSRSVYFEEREAAVALRDDLLGNPAGRKQP